MRRVAPDEVELTVALVDVEHPGPKGPPGPPGVHGIRRDRLVATDEDRDVAVTQLRIAFVEDQLTVDDLERRVERAHGATRLRELDALLTYLD